MKKFLVKIILFLFFLQLPLLIESFLPLDIFTNDLGLTLKNNFYLSTYGPSIPNITFTQTEKGVLALGTDFENLKKNTRIIDELGYRNRKLEKKPDIVFIGDSQTEGAQLNQTEIFSEVIKKHTSFKTYSLAPSQPDVLEILIRDKKIQKPKIIIFETFERELYNYKYDINTLKKTEIKAKIIEKFQDFFLISKLFYFFNKYSRNYLIPSIKANLLGRRKYPQSYNDKSIYFYQGKLAEINLSENDLNNLVQQYVLLNNYYKKNGIFFIFIPFPNAETIYYEKVPFRTQPTFLKRFIDKLIQNKVNVVNTLDLFNKNKNKDLYYFDDSHGHPNSIEIINRELIEILKKNNFHP